MDSNKPPSAQKETPEENFYVHPEKESKQSLQYRLNKFRQLLSSRTKVAASIMAVLVLTASIGIGVYLTKQEHRTNVSAGSVDLTLTTSKANPVVGETFTVAVAMNTNGSPVNTADIQVTYNSNLMTATSITNGGFLPTTLIAGNLTAPGLATIAVSCPFDTVAHPITGSGLVAQVTFQAIKANTSKVDIGANTIVYVSGQPVNSLGVVTPVQITVMPATSPTPTPTKSPTPRPVTPIPTPTKSPSPTPTKTPSPGPGTPTPTPSPTRSPSPTPRTPSPTPTKSPSPTPRTPSPTPTPVRIPGDVNGDGHVNIVDIGFVVDNYDTTPLLDQRCDLNGDGIANIVDIGIIVDHYEL